MPPKSKRTPDKLITRLWLEGKSYRQIASLLTRNGLIISHQTIKNRLLKLGVTSISKPFSNKLVSASLWSLHQTAKRLLDNNKPETL